MATLDQLRALFPDAETDADVITQASERFKISPADIASEVGYSQSRSGLTGQQFSSAIDRYQAGLYGVGEAALGAIGAESASGWMAAQRRENELRADLASERAREMGAVQEWKDVHGIGDFGSYAKGLAIQSVPYAAEALAGGLVARGLMSGTRAALAGAQTVEELAAAKKALNIGSTIGGVAASYPSAVGDVLGSQREEGQTNFGAAAALGVPYAALNAFGIEGSLSRGMGARAVNILDRAGGATGAAARTSAAMVKSGVQEAFGETGQEMINQLGRMAVNPEVELFDEKAIERYKESAIGGAVLGGAFGSVGGWRRSSSFLPGSNQGGETSATPDAPKNEISQEFTAKASDSAENLMAGMAGQPNLLGGRASLYEAPTVAAAPAVAGGETDVALAQQQAAAEAQATQAALQQQATRERIYSEFGIADPQDPTKGSLFGKPLYGPTVPAVADAVAAITQSMTPVQLTLANAINQASAATGNTMLNFQFNANDPAKSVQKAFDAVGKVAAGLQIGHVQSVDEAAQILNEQSNTLKGQKLDQLNAVYSALTGEDTVGYIAAQQLKATKGAKDGKLQLQTNAGVGEVPVQGGAGEAISGGAGAVRPAQVQPLGAGSLGAGPTGQQAGQPTAGGVRAGPAADVNAGDVLVAGQGQGPGQVNEQPAETVGQTTQAAVQPAGQGATAPSMGQPAGRTQAVPEAGQVSTAAEVLADRMEAIADEAMQLLVPPTSRMDEATAQKQRDFIFTLLVNGPYDSLAVMAADFGIKESQAKDWSAKAKAMQDDPTKLAAAFRAVADQHGITVAELMDGIGVKAAQEAAQAPEQVVAGTERELIDEGLEVKGRKSGESLQERYNKVETNQAKYLRLSEQLEAAENDGDEEAAARISAELDAVLAKGVEQSDKRSKRAAPKAAKAKTGAPTTAAEELSEDKRKAQEAEAAKLRAEIAAKTAAERKGLEVGDTVVNPKLGTGTVLSFAGNGASTTVTVKFKSGETKELSVAAAKLEKTNAVQEPSAEEVSVRQRARGGKAVGEGDTEGGKAAAEGKPAAEEIRTPQEQWETLAEKTPGMPPYESLTKEEKGRWDDLAHRGVANLAAANEIVGGGDLKFGKDTTESKVKNPYTAAQLLAEIKAFVRADIPGRKLIIVDSVEALLASPDPKVREVAQALARNGAYGVASDGRGFLIANRIEQGRGRAKFMHEVGAHLGLETLLPKALYDKLTQQLVNWAKRADGSLESDLAVRAAERVMHAGTPKEDQRSELLAYFIEEAMQAGIDPTAEVKNSPALTAWFRTLWAAFKVAVRKLGFNPERLTAQDVVNLAFGAARLEMSGTFHGTAAQFRKFSHKFMGSGEGAQAYGWGTYLAQRPGIAKGYWAADIGRKGGENEGALMRVDTALDSSNTLNWDTPLSQQPEVLATLREKLPTPIQEAIADQFDQNVEDLEDLTGEDLYRALQYLENSQGLVTEFMENEPAGQKGDKVASKFLDSLGIAGLKFLDASSRKQARAEERIAQAERKLAREEQALRDLHTQLGKERQELMDKLAAAEAEVAAGKKWSKMSVDQMNRFIARLDDPNGTNALLLSVYEDNVRLARDNLATQQAKLTAPVTRNLVVFNDANIFRVGSAIGADKQRMKFGIESKIERLPAAAQKPVRNSIASITDWANKALDRVVFTSDLLNRAVDAGISSAKKFERLLAERGTKARALERDVERIADMYAALPEKDKGTGPDSVNQFLFDSTRTMKWGYGKDRDAEMGARFDALDPKTQAFVKAVFAHGDKILSKKKQTVLDYASSEYDALIAATTDPTELAKLKADKAADLKKFASMFAIREGKPYAPIKRVGDYVVVAKSEAYRKAEELNDTAALNRFKSDPDHYHVSFTETKGEARALADQLREQGFFGDSADAVDFFEKTKFGRDEMANSSTLDALTRLRSVINARAAEGDKGAAAMQTLVTDLFLQNLSESSARKSEMRRRGVAGEVDMLRSFASQGRADAQFLASIEMNPQVQDAVQEMRGQVKQGGNRDRKSSLMNEIMARYEKSLDRVNTPTIDKLTRLSSIWFLATSPAYYFQNLTQPWMMSVPAMAGRHNYSSSSTALFKAYSELGPLMKSAKLFEQQFDFSKVPADVRDAIQELANRGKIDIGLETELGEFKIDGSGKLTDRWNKVDKGMRIAVQKVEAINRLSTAIAAYRLELAKTGSADAALDYADRILTETHGDYTAFNSPRVFNNPVGKVALQFRKFQLIQLTFYAKLIRDAYEGKDRAMALKTLAYSLGHTGMLAGVMGLPGYAAISAILGALLGDDDEEYDLTKELRTMIGDEDIANLILRGAPTIAGMDLSGKVGAGNMLSIMPFSNADLTTKSGVYEALGQLLGGAAAGMAAKFADGLGLMLSGDWYKGLEQMLPKGLADPMKAARIANEGMTRRNGDVVLPASEISSLGTVWQAIGLSPVKQAVVYERQQNIRDMGQKFQDRSTEIKNRYTKAAKSGDTAEMAAQRDAWAKLQAARTNSGYTRQPMSELLKAPQDQAKRERQTVGGVQYNKANRAAVLAEANL